MRFISSRRRARLAIAVVCAVLVSGCGGQAADSTAAPEPTASTLPPTTTIPPLTAEEVAWLDGLPKLTKTLEEKKNKIYQAATTGLTRALMVSLGKTLGSCSRELARLGAPTDRLQPVAAVAESWSAARSKRHGNGRAAAQRLLSRKARSSLRTRRQRATRSEPQLESASPAASGDRPQAGLE
jgi:hypothetical protein